MSPPPWTKMFSSASRKSRRAFSKRSPPIRANKSALFSILHCSAGFYASALFWSAASQSKSKRNHPLPITINTGAQIQMSSPAKGAENSPAGPRFDFLDLRAQFSTIRDEVMQAVAQVFESQHFILGPEVKLLEDEIAAKLGSKFAIGCASGTDALILSLLSAGIGQGDEV